MGDHVFISHTGIGRELKQIGVGALGIFLFDGGKLLDHRKLPYVCEQGDYIQTMERLFGVKFR